MTPEIALGRLSQLCVEYVQNLKDMPATREAVAMYAQAAIDVLRETINQAQTIHDGNPPA